jgi:hypothetical protein
MIGLSFGTSINMVLKFTLAKSGQAFEAAKAHPFAT